VKTERSYLKLFLTSLVKRLVTPIQVNILMQRSTRCLSPLCAVHSARMKNILSVSHNHTYLYP